MINSAYYIPRTQLIEWINDLLITSITKIEQLGSGSVYCQILDAAYPDSVPLQKVKWHAYLEVDFLYNLRLLQNSLQKLGINKLFNAQKLAKVKFHENLEFIQWMKWSFADRIDKNGVYNALARRNHQKINLLFTEQKHFDLKQTVSRDARGSKQTPLLKSVRMVQSVGVSQEETLKTSKSVLGLKQINFNSPQAGLTFRRGELAKRLGEEKENPLRMRASKGVCDIKLKMKKIEGTIPVHKPLKELVVVQSVPLVDSDEQCF